MSFTRGFVKLLPSFRRWLIPTAVLIAAVRCGGGDSLTLPSDKLPANITVEGGDGQQGVVGKRLTDTLVVRITDTKDRPVQDQKIAFKLLAGGSAADLIPDTALTDVDGRARSVWVLGSIAGGQRVEARVLGAVAGNVALHSTFNATALADVADTLVPLQGDLQTGTVGTTLTDSLVVVVTDRFANPVAGQSVNWSVPGGQGSVSAASVVTGADGHAAVTRTLGPTAGGQTAQATVAGLKGSPVTFTATATSGGAVRLVKVFGDAQTAPAGFQLTDSVVVQLQDANGNGVPNRNVNWVVTDGGSASPLTSATDAQGKAFTYWTLKPTAGSNQLTAAAAGVPQIQFSATGTSAQPAKLQALSSLTLSGTVGLPVTPVPSVKVTDQNNNPVQGVTVNFQVTAGGGGVSDGGPSSPNATVATNASGVATLVSWTLGTVAGASNTLSATAAGTGIAGNGIVFTASAAAGAAARIQLTTQPSASGQSGIVLAQQPVLQLRDAFGNALSQSGVQVTAAVVGGGAQLRGTTTVATSAAGIASFSGLNLVGPVGSYSLGFTAGALAGDTSTAITLAAGVPGRLAIVTQPSAAVQSGIQFATQPVLQVQDSAGNPVAANGVNVTAAIASGAGVLGGTLTVATSAAGTATYTDLEITGALGTRTLGFSATGLIPVVSGNVTVGAGAATQLGITTQPSASAQSGSVFAQQPVVELRDASGTPVPQPGVSVTATITGAPAGVTLGGTATLQTTAQGNVSFSGLSLTGPAGNYSLSFSATGLVGASSSGIALAAGSGTTLTITTAPPATGQSGVALSPATVIQLRDGSGNPANQAGVAVAASIASGAGGTLGGTDTVLTNASGVATFSNLVLSGPVGGYTLAFSGTGLTGVTAPAATTLSAGPAARVAVLTQPASTAQSGVIFATQPILELQDAAGNPVSQAGTTITATIGSGGGSLGGTVAQLTGGNGQASYTDLLITGTVGPRTLDFSATGLTKATSATITLSAGAAATMVKQAGDNQSATAGSPVAVDPQVKVTDASGNPVQGVTVGFAVTGGGGSAGASATTDVNGLASVGWTLGTTAGANSLDATATLAGGPATVTFHATGTAGSAGRLAITTQPSATAASGVVFAQQPVIQLQDALGNNVNTSGVVITAQSSGGSLGGTATVVTANGVATFSNLSLTGTVGSYTLTFTGTNLTGVTSSAINLTAGQATALVIVTQPDPNGQSGVPLVQQPVLQVVDAAGNPVSSAGRQVTAAINSGPGGTVNAVGRQVTTSGSGTASFTSLRIDGPVGTYTLLFSTSALTADVSSNIALAAGPAATISANSVTSQSAPVGTAVSAPPSVLVTDGAGNPVSGVTVNFAVTAGGGSLNGASPVTDPFGVATVTAWTLGGAAGANTVTATLSGVAGSPVTFNATGTAGTATSIAINTGNNQTATVNTNVATAPSVKITDAGGNPVANVAVSFAVASGGGSALGTSATSNTLGIATVGSWTLGTVAGSNTLNATATLLGTPTTVTFTATGVAGAAATLTKTAGDNQTAPVSSLLPVAPQVQIQDQFGNPKSGVSVSFVPAAGSGSVTGGTATTNSSGLATLGSWTIGSTAGTNTLTATAAGGAFTGNPATFTATGTAGGPASVAANSTTTQNATVGTAVAAPPSVIVRDALNNPVSGATVTFAITAGPAGVLVGATQTTNGSGIATVTSWTVDTTVRTNTVTATVTGAGITGNPVSFTATGLAGPATRIIMNRQPSTTVQSGVIFPITPRVQVADQYNNAVATAAPGVVITASVLTSPGGSPGIAPLTATTSTTGLATFTNFTLTGLVGSYTFQFDASASGFGTVASSAVTLTAGPATALSITTQPPASASSGVAFSTAPVLQLRDGAGNPVTTSGIAITATIASGPGGGSLSNAVATTVNGAATFTGLTLSGTSGSYTLSFAGTGLTPIVSSTIALGAGGGSQLAVVTQPSASAVNGTAFASQPVIELQDAIGNPVLTAGVAVTASIASGGGSLGGTLTVNTNASGQAVFTNLSITGTVGSHTLLFAASGFTGVTSGTINLTAGAPSTVTIQQQPSASAQNTVAFAAQPIALVKDQSNNVVPSTGVVASLASGAGTLGGTLTANTDAFGVASFSNLEITGLIGTRTLKLQAGSASAVTNGVNITAGPVSGAQSTASVPAGTVGLATSITVQARDVSGNPVTTGGATVAVSVTGANSATPAVLDNGNGSYSASYTPTAAGSDNVAITLNGVAVSGSPFTSSVGAAGSVTTITSVSAASTVVGQSYTVNVSVTGAGVTPTGNVTVSDGTGATCLAVLSGGAGSCAVTSTTAGAKSLVASYAGDANYGGSSSAATAHTVNAAATTTAVSTTPTSTTSGGTYTVNFTVTANAPGGGTPTGTVNVSDGAGGTCSAALSGGAGSCQLSTGLVGTRTITATYAGTADYSTSSGTASHTVTLLGSTTTITANTPNPSVIGQSVTFSVSVTSLLGTPGGTVTITDGATTLCTATLSGGAGSCSFTFTSAGTRTVTATYSGDATHGGSSNTASQQVDPFGAPAKLAFSVQPSTTPANTVISPFPEVQVLDAFGNLVTTATDNVTLSIGTDPSGGSAIFNGTLIVAAINGVAVFPGLSIDTPGSGYTLDANATGLTGTTSTAFDIQ